MVGAHFFFSASRRLASASMVMTGLLIMPLAGMLKVSTFSPVLSPVVWRSFGWNILSSMSRMLIMPMIFPSSMTGTWEKPCSLNRLSTAPTDLWASMVYGARVITLLTLFLPQS